MFVNIALKTSGINLTALKKVVMFSVVNSLPIASALPKVTMLSNARLISWTIPTKVAAELIATSKMPPNTALSDLIPGLTFSKNPLKTSNTFLPKGKNASPISSFISLTISLFLFFNPVNDLVAKSAIVANPDPFAVAD